MKAFQATPLVWLVSREREREKGGRRRRKILISLKYDERMRNMNMSEKMIRTQK